MKHLILIMSLTFAACSSACSSAPHAPPSWPQQASLTPTPIPWPDGTSHAPYIDLSLCTARTDVPGVPVYDGEVWHLGSSTEGIRCPLPVEEQDVFMAWRILGRHATAGPAVTTACLQAMETQAAVPMAMPHVNVVHDGAPSCVQIAASSAGGFDESKLLYSEPFEGVVDKTLSLWIRGNGFPDELIAAVQAYIVRP